MSRPNSVFFLYSGLKAVEEREKKNEKEKAGSSWNDIGIYLFRFFFILLYPEMLSVL